MCVSVFAYSSAVHILVDTHTDTGNGMHGYVAVRCGRVSWCWCEYAACVVCVWCERARCDFIYRSDAQTCASLA